MQLRRDDRGVTVQIGTVLLFAVLIILLSIYQASVVPQQNKQVEFTHNQRVQGQLQDLRDELHRTAITGSGGSTSVALGTQYPVRAFFVNPPPPSGTMRTTPAANLTVENATATGEVGDYWNGTDRNFSTRGLTYRPLYHVYQNPPTTVYDNGVLYNQFEGATRVLAGQRLVRGNTISVVAVNGTLSESSSTTATVDFRAVSAATRTVTVGNDSANVSVVVPTTLSAGKWEELLAAELNQSVGDDRYVLAVEDGPRADTVRVVLEPETYELRMAKVGVGTGVTGVGPHYVTDAAGDNSSVAENSTRQLVVEVRDRYNNPVSGARVNATLATGLTGDAIAAQGSQSSGSLRNLTTDSEGRVTVRYLAPDDVDGASRPVTVDVSATAVPGPAFDSTTRTNLSFDLTVVNTDGSGRGPPGGGPPGGNGSDGAYQTKWNRSAIESEAGATCYGNDTCRYDRASGNAVTLTANTTPVADSAQVRFAVNDTNLATFASDTQTTGTDGRATVDLNTQTTGNVTVYASSGGSGDSLAVEVYDSGGGGGGGAPGNDPPTASFTANCGNLTCSFDASGSSDAEGNVQSYDWAFGDGSTGTGETTSHTYGSDGTYTVTLTVTDNNGQTDTAQKQVTVTAPTQTPSVDFRVDDLSHVDTDRVRYVASYGVSNTNASFERVSVVYDNANRGPSATGVNNSTATRGNRRYGLNYGADEEWTVTIRVVYTNDAGEEYVAVSESITDTADALNPGANDALSTSGSPTVGGYGVSDQSNNGQGVRYRIDYGITTNGNFSRVEGVAIGLGGGGTDSTADTAANGRLELRPSYGRGTQFRVKLLVFDDEGAVVAVRAETDTAD